MNFKIKEQFSPTAIFEGLRVLLEKSVGAYVERGRVACRASEPPLQRSANSLDTELQLAGYHGSRHQL